MKKIISLSLIVFSLFMILSCTGKKPSYRKISVEEYMDKVKAGWVGQMVGVGWGGPTEFKWQGKIIPEDKVPKWTPERVNQFNQDDIYVEMTFLRSLEKHGFDVSIRQAGIDFANSEYMLWHANRAGRDNLRSGIAPPYSGHPDYNKHADDIDYQIEADFAGLISPGLPNQAIDLGEIFGRLMNFGDGLYGGQFVAGMYAEAFFEENMEKIVEAGLKCIPSGSQYYEAITDVLAWYRENPFDWQNTWEKINNKYHLNPEYRKFSCSGTGSFNIDAKINGAYIVMGLLYGKGNIKETTVIATRCGQDSDCNPSNAAGILFTTIGFNNLPEEYKSALDYETRFSYTDYNVNELIDVCEKLARETVVRNGGKIETGEDGEEYFLIPISEPEAGELEQCWDAAPVMDDVMFTQEEMAHLRFKIISSMAHIHSWMVAGPYSYEGMDNKELFNLAFEPEINPEKVTWEKMPMGGDYSDWMADLGKLYKKENAVAYLKTQIESEKEQDATLYVGSDDGIKIWLNGELVHQINVNRGFQPGEDSVKIHLMKGWNTCLMKITQGSGDWSAAAAVCDSTGCPLGGLSYK